MQSLDAPNLTILPVRPLVVTPALLVIEPTLFHFDMSRSTVVVLCAVACVVGDVPINTEV